MREFVLAAVIAQWFVLFVLGVLVIGTLRGVGVLRWQVEQLQATTPRRVGRDGLGLGTTAPGFALRAVEGGEHSLEDFRGRKVLLVFTQSGCGPCHAILPELIKLHRRGEHQVVVVNNGEPDETRDWAAGAGVPFPVLMQEKFALSRRYEVYATPFAFVIDEGGVITSKGIIGSREHLGYVLKGAGRKAKPMEGPAGPAGSGAFGGLGSATPGEVTHA